MELTQELFQKCRRISAAIQKFLNDTGMKNARSTDLYDYLARQGLVEKDRHNGLHFRAFLRELKDANLLHLIKQCSFVENGKYSEWYFNLASPTQKDSEIVGKVSKKLHQPVMDKYDLELLLNSEKANVEDLPVRNDLAYSSQQLEIKSYYPRAYEYWTELEYEILRRVYDKCKNVDAVAMLLKRQPHVVKEKIDNIGI